jgi:hypothetical protein
LGQGFSNFFAGLPLNEIQQFQCTTFFLTENLKLERLAYGGSELRNVASSAALCQMFYLHLKNEIGEVCVDQQQIETFV